jgi:hypothetical protein
MAGIQQGVNMRDYLANLDKQINYFTNLKKQYESAVNNQFNEIPINKDESLWVKIDNEVANIDKYTSDALASDENYKNINTQLQSIVQQELLFLVRDKVETSDSEKSSSTSGENPSGDDITEEEVKIANMDRPNKIENKEEGKLNLMMHSFMC